jgi:hypothetical protein
MVSVLHGVLVAPNVALAPENEPESATKSGDQTGMEGTVSPMRKGSPRSWLVSVAPMMDWTDWAEKAL